jgi:Mg/Co/Ni transporter MgtE
MKKNVPIVGFIIGLVLPFVGFFIVYLLWRSRGEGFGEFARSLTHRSGMTSKVLTLSLLPNLIPFIYCNMKRLDYAMKGIVIATCLYAVFIFIIMFVW